MIDVESEILDYLAKFRDDYKRILRPIQLRRNKLYISDPVEEWQEISDSYEVAIVIQLFDDLSERMDLPVDELYISLHDMKTKLSEFFEPSN